MCKQQTFRHAASNVTVRPLQPQLQIMKATT
jgi:hypothetical protein